jgi:hypothetical protein
MRYFEIDESFNSRHEKQVVKSTPNGTTVKANIGGREIVFMVHISVGMDNKKTAMIEFSEKTDGGKYATYDKTGSGSEMQVFSFVIDCVRDAIIDFDPDKIDFTAVKADGNRGRLYKKLASKIPGYKLQDVQDGRYEELYTFVKDK